MSDAFFRRPLGLAISGGGTHGTWQAGALQALLQGGRSFDAVQGFSAGALNGTAVALGILDAAVRRWEGMDGGVLRLSPRLFPPSLFSNRPLWEAAELAGSDDESRRRLLCRLIIASARSKRDRLVYAVYTPGGREGWDGPLASHLVASCAIPLVFPPLDITYRGTEQSLFDGGVPCREPMSFAELGACQDVILVQSVRRDEAAGRVGGPMRALDKRGRETIVRLMDQGVESLRVRPGPPRIFRLEPSRPLDFLMLDFKASNLRPALEQGRRDAEAFLRDPGRHLVGA